MTLQPAPRAPAASLQAAQQALRLARKHCRWPVRAVTFIDGVPVPRDSEQLADGCERVRDESQQADLVTVGAESGGVVWWGRTKTGDVAAIVVTSGMPDAKA